MTMNHAESGGHLGSDCWGWRIFEWEVGRHLNVNSLPLSSICGLG